MDKIKQQRNFMKANFKELQGIQTDQMKQLPQPSLEKPAEEGHKLIELIPIEKIKIKRDTLIENIKNRKSRRNFSNEPLTVEDLSFLLWASQGVKEVIKRLDKAYATLRTVPSAGARHAFETYLIIHNVSGLEPGVYRYLPIEHKLIYLYSEKNLKEKIIEATLGQKFTGNCSVIFIWSCVAYRGEWRYFTAAHKAMLLDVGHVCQNLYLACEAIDAGTCAIAAYDQEKVDKIIQVDGEEEYTIYLAPVGKY
ncbi:MAG: SagB/ThcOx family dehydrogenase [Candidatus Cloacimonetes bacterium]|nr:SagB/ThcOx family dehydrogenase [Candidatus Cloacimonadota bacterium]